MNSALLLANGANAMPDFGSVFFVCSNVGANGERTIEWVGTLITWLLLATSIFSMGLAGTLLRSTRLDSFCPRRVGQSAGDGTELARILSAARTAAPLGREAALLAGEEAADACLNRRLRAIEPLHIIAQASPMVGLFGTVYGVIHSFWTVASTGGNANPVLLAGGIGTALVATFWGLVVAIPALVIHALLRNRIEDRTALALDMAISQLAAGEGSRGN